MLIPQVGDWVDCFEKESPGKVSAVGLEKEEFTGDFFTEWTCQEDVGGTGEDTLPLSKIKEIIKEKELIELLERELRGEISFEDPYL